MANKKDESVIAEGKLGICQIIETRRPNGRLRIQQNFEFCPSQTDQSLASVTDPNELMKKHTSLDEVQQYLAMVRPRQEIKGYDFTREPSLQDAMGEVARLRQAYNDLPEDVREKFPDHVKFLKFIDNPQNQKMLLSLGLLTEKQIEATSTVGLAKEKGQVSEEPPAPTK